MGREDRIAAFEASLVNVEVLPFDDATARIAGRINADLQNQGRIIGMPDVMIAAIALHHRLALVTGNVAHFEYVRALGHELGIDNWRDPATQDHPAWKPATFRLVADRARRLRACDCRTSGAMR